jgi:hypothetical protein
MTKRSKSGDASPKKTPDLMETLNEGSLIKDHQFEPRGEWWALCKHCGLAGAAHASSTAETRAEREAYFKTVRRATPVRLPSYEREFDTESGRPLVSYMGDDDDD